MMDPSTINFGEMLKEGKNKDLTKLQLIYIDIKLGYGIQLRSMASSVGFPKN